MLQTKTLFDELFGLHEDWFTGWNDGARPEAWQKETEEGLRLWIPLAGYRREGVEIEFRDGILEVRGQGAPDRPAGEEGEEKAWRPLFRERRTGPFRLRYNLSEKLDPENIRARFEDGVLVLDVPRRPETRARKIEIK